MLTIFCILKTSEDRYDKLRVHAEEKILEANKEIAAVREQYESQITALKMKVKTGEREVSSLKRQCETKVKQASCSRLKMCDFSSFFSGYRQ